jgi:uncharacterized protein (TIGR02145 family)
MPSTTITTSEKEISLSLTPTITGYHIQGDLSPDEMRDSGTDETPDIVAGVPTFLKTQDFTAQLDFDNNANFLSPTTVTTEFKVDSGAGYGSLVSYVSNTTGDFKIKFTTASLGSAGSGAYYYRVTLNCHLPNTFTDPIQDHVDEPERHTYEVVRIGDLYVTASNWRGTLDQDGDNIPNYSNNIQSWRNTSGPARSDYVYHNESWYTSNFGWLYNYYATTGSGVIWTPTDWRIANEDDWRHIMTTANTIPEPTDSINNAALSMRSQITTAHENCNGGEEIGWHEGYEGTNDSGFNALANGWRSYGNWAWINHGAWWWQGAGDGGREGYVATYPPTWGDSLRIVYSNLTMTIPGRGIRLVKDV